uniref:ZP domain-containing protein n=1 Tax=Panagrellus redivivus TaxID=6233 RepID=A0A7E4VFK0_PANRE
MTCFIPRNQVRSFQLRPDVSTTRGLKWWLDCYPNSRNSSAGPCVANLFVISLRVSHMPVKCKVRYTLANISETTEIICSKLIEPTIFSISRDVLLIQNTSDDGLTFTCDVTFTHVPKTIGIPVQVSSSQSRSFTGTITIVVRLQDHKDLYETPEYPIDGKMVWSVLGCMHKGKKGYQIRIRMRTSAAFCHVMLTCEHAASDTFHVRRDGIKAANPKTDYCKAVFYPTNEVKDNVMAIKCTAYFTFRYPIQPCITRKEQSIATVSDPLLPQSPPMALNPGQGIMGTAPLIRRPTKSSFPWQYFANGYHKSPNPQPFPNWYPKPLNQRKFTVSTYLPIKTLRSSNDYKIKSDIQNGPGDLRWWIQCEPDTSHATLGSSPLVSWHVSKKPIEANVKYTELFSNKQHEMKVVVGTDDPVPKLLFKTNNDVALSQQSDDEYVCIKCCFTFPKNSSDDICEPPSEDVPVSDNESDDASNLSSSEDDSDGSSDEDGMTDQQRLAYRLQRQDEETLAVQKFLANNKNIPMIADGSIF